MPRCCGCRRIPQSKSQPMRRRRDTCFACRRLWLSAHVSSCMVRGNLIASATIPYKNTLGMPLNDDRHICICMLHRFTSNALRMDELGIWCIGFHKSQRCGKGHIHPCPGLAKETVQMRIAPEDRFPRRIQLRGLKSPQIPCKIIQMDGNSHKVRRYHCRFLGPEW